MDSLKVHKVVIASGAKQFRITYMLDIMGLLRRKAPRNDMCWDFLLVHQGWKRKKLNDPP